MAGRVAPFSEGVLVLLWRWFSPPFPATQIQAQVAALVAVQALPPRYAQPYLQRRVVPEKNVAQLALSPNSGRASVRQLCPDGALADTGVYQQTAGRG